MCTWKFHRLQNFLELMPLFPVSLFEDFSLVSSHAVCQSSSGNDRGLVVIMIWPLQALLDCVRDTDSLSYCLNIFFFVINVLAYLFVSMCALHTNNKTITTLSTSLHLNKITKLKYSQKLSHRIPCYQDSSIWHLFSFKFFFAWFAI